jgi:hypothetical protein
MCSGCYVVMKKNVEGEWKGTYKDYNNHNNNKYFFNNLPTKKFKLRKILFIKNFNTKK